MQPIEQVRTYVEAIMLDKPNGLFVNVFTLDPKGVGPYDKASSWGQTTDEVVEYVSRFVGDWPICKVNLYMGMGLVAEKPGRGGRANKDSVCALGGLWLDLDYADPVNPTAHKKAPEKMPAGRDEALAFLQPPDLPPPSMIVDSGHGLHAYWLFPTVRELGEQSDPRHIRAAQLIEVWQRMFIDRGRQRGWDIDSTMDLARILRVPGTWNSKPDCPPVRAEIIQFNPEVRYEPSYLWDACEAHKTGKTGNSGSKALAALDGNSPVSSNTAPTRVLTAPALQINLDPDANPPAGNLAQLMLDPRFSMAWQGQNPGGDTSASGLDMVVAVSAAKSGWSPQEIADLLICRRKARGDEFKLDRLDYFQLTIQRALDAAGEGVVVKAASPAYERGPEPPSAVALPASHALQTAPTNEAELFAWMNGLPESIHSFRLSFTDAIPPVGFVHEYFGVVEASGSDAYPGFTLSSALVDLSMAVGRKRYIEYFGKLFGNIYAMLVGHPHVSRKNQTAETARGIVRQALGRDWLVSGDTTPQALVARLAEHGIRVWVNTEVGKMLDAIKRGTYNAGLDTVLRDLYTCGECGLDRKQERDSVLAEHTFLSVLVAAPTRSLERFTTDEMVEDGLISRFLVAVSPADANTRDSLPKGSLDTTSLVESLRSIDRTISNPHGEMVQIVVREEEEQSMSLKGVERAVEAWLDGLQKWIPVDQENIDTMGAFRGRLLTATLKIALLLSLAKDPRCTEIDPASLYYAMVATVCYARDMLKLLRRLLQDWEQRLEERILARIGATIDKAIDEATGDQTKLQGLLDRPGHIHIKRRALQQNLRLPSGLPYGMTPSKALDTALRGLSEAGMVQWMKADIYVPFGTLTEAQQRAILVVSDLLSNKNAGRDGTGSGATPPSGTEPQQGGGDG